MRRRPAKSRLTEVSPTRLDQLIAEATIDCHSESEEFSGMYTSLGENLEFPFETRVLGVVVKAERLELTEAGEVVALCRKGRDRQAVSILELPLPNPAPRGAEWIEAYRRWARRR